MRTVNDIREGYIMMKWDIVFGCTAHKDDYLLDNQLFFVLRGLASPKFLDNTVTVCLITTCFKYEFLTCFNTDHNMFLRECLTCFKHVSI